MSFVLQRSQELGESFSPSLLLSLCLSLALASVSQAAEPAPANPQNTQVLGQTTQSPSAPSGTAASTHPSPDKDLHGQFDDAMRQMFPLGKEEIQEYRHRSDQRDRALSPASPVLNTRTVRVHLEPGRAPEKVLCTANIATSLVFHDSTGQPWPVTSVTNGAPAFFHILRPELPEGNLLNVMPVREYGASTIVVTLAKRDVPLVIRLESDSVKGSHRKADAMVLFQVGHHGPNARTPIIQNIRETVTSSMLAFLDHVPPSGALYIRMEPKIEGVEIWNYNQTNYIRTSHTLMWPAWTGVVNGAGDVKCYEVPPTPRILLSKNGAIHTLTLKEPQKDRAKDKEKAKK